MKFRFIIPAIGILFFATALLFSGESRPTTQTAVAGDVTPDIFNYLPLVLKPVGTPTATPTATATATSPPPTSTPMPPDVVILPNFSSELSGSLLNIWGEVSNQTSSKVWLIEVTVNIYNNSNQLIDIISTFTALDLPPGERTCFFFFEYQVPPGYSHFEFEPVDYFNGGPEIPNLTVTDASSVIQGDLILVSGTFRNDDLMRVDNLKAVGTFYDSFGKTVGCIISYEIGDQFIDPGQATSFLVPYYANLVNTYRIQPGGDLP